MKISNSSCFGGLKMIYSSDSIFKNKENLLLRGWTKHDSLRFEKGPELPNNYLNTLNPWIWCCSLIALSDTPNHTDISPKILVCQIACAVRVKEMRFKEIKSQNDCSR